MMLVRDFYPKALRIGVGAQLEIHDFPSFLVRIDKMNFPPNDGQAGRGKGPSSPSIHAGQNRSLARSTKRSRAGGGEGKLLGFVNN
jgi:hypothetical protein